MSLLRHSFRAPAALNRTCTRCLSTGPGASSGAGGLVDVLSASTAQSAPRQNLASRLAGRMLPGAQSQSRALEEASRRSSYQRQMYRKWNAGDVYAPHDLSGSEQKKWKFGRRTPASDNFDRLGINPVSEYKNFTLMSEFMTEMGRIKHSKETGLRPKNQRKIARAIRRAIGLGLMPSVHRHPLVLRKAAPSRFL